MIRGATAEIGAGEPPCQARPREEHLSWLFGSPSEASPTHDIVSIVDAAGVSGTDDPSGGAFNAEGILRYRYVDHLGQSSKVACTLPHQYEA